jgi:UDP-glucose 4-epimerase
MTIKILVTGGGGYIGSHGVYHLLDAGFTPVVVDDFSTGHRSAIADGVAVYDGNVGDQHLLGQIFADHDIAVVMHFAGSVVVPESIVNPGKYYANNTGNTLGLLNSMTKVGIKHMVFSSTAAVYGNPDPSLLPVREDTPPMPLNPYGTSKLMSEMMINDMAKAYGMTAVILRYFNVAGADAKGRAGQSTPEATHLIKIAAEVLSKKRKEMNIFGTDYDTADGTCVRDYIHVDDLVDAHLLALDYLIGGGASVTLNCGYGRGSSVIDVINAMNNLGHGTISATATDRRPGDAAVLIADNTACRKILGWTPKYDDLSVITRSALAWETSYQKS